MTKSKSKVFSDPPVSSDFPHFGRAMVFDEVVDISRPVGYGAVDLRLLASESAVPSDVSASQGDFNDIDDPNSILGRPRDPFDEVAMQKAVKGYKAPSKDVPAE